MISIDTSIMRNLVTASTTANNAITDAMEVLNRISNHNDWACKEKDAINDYTNTNKNRIRQLQENSSSFLIAITGATTEFEETETSISDMFSSVESMISNILSITAATTGVIGGPLQHGTPIADFPSGFSNIIKDVLKDIVPQTRQEGYNPLEAFIANNVTEPIALCNFSDIDLG